MSESIEMLRKQMKEKQIVRIAAMQPGRELDAIVAEFIMGQHIRRIGDDEELADYWYRKQTNRRIVDHDEMERVPNYSTVLYSAGSIIGKFKHWRIQSGEGGEGVEAWFSNTGTPSTWAKDCSTVPEAICKAALLALVDENKMIDKLFND